MNPAAKAQEVGSGLVIVDKPEGITSHTVVSRVRRALGTRKVGHAGTLDPMATGVLVLGVNRATRLLGYLMKTEKGYQATIRLGASTITDDREGDVTDLASPAAMAALSQTEIRSALERFVGEIDQVPTAVSAIKVDGKRAYQRVRDGEEVALAARRVQVHDIRCHQIERREEPFIDADVFVRCSSGTYIRAIARDLGAALGVGGHLTALRRTHVGAFDLGAAVALDEVGPGSMLDLSAVARASFPSVDLDDEQSAAVRFGRALALDLVELSAVFDPAGAFLALYQPSTPGLAKPVAVFVG